MERLIREIKAAKKRGVNVDEVFVDNEGRLKRLDTLLMGVRWSIVFTFVYPVLLYGMKFLAAVLHVPFDLPEKEILNFTTWSASSMIAFGFGSGVMTLVRAMRKKAYEELSHLAVELISDRDADNQSSTSGRSKAQDAECDSQDS
ncbi:MAG: hypothetical protein K2Y32_00345 [Candidatus Obscuribacterales bacterium]|nr:hypothetical protein [Candidatus Obscuribacterales bacterium]